VVTAAHIRTRSARLLDHEFRLLGVPRTRVTGATLVWRGTRRVPVSDRERTIVDCLRHPELCGGIQHLVQILERVLASLAPPPETRLGCVLKSGLHGHYNVGQQGSAASHAPS
jgi:hypothetical protein